MSRRARYLALEATLREQLDFYLESNEYKKTGIQKNVFADNVFKGVLNFLKKERDNNNIKFNQKKLDEEKVYNLFNIFTNFAKTLDNNLKEQISDEAVSEIILKTVRLYLEENIIQEIIK